jgi:ankyrin repeat protein
MAAAGNNQLEFVKWLLAQGASVNASKCNGWTALHAAARGNHYDVLGALLEGGSDRNITAHHGSIGFGFVPADVTRDARIIGMLQQ